MDVIQMDETVRDTEDRCVFLQDVALLLRMQRREPVESMHGASIEEEGYEFRSRYVEGRVFGTWEWKGGMHRMDRTSTRPQNTRTKGFLISNQQRDSGESTCDCQDCDCSGSHGAKFDVHNGTMRLV